MFRFAQNLTIDINRFYYVGTHHALHMATMQPLKKTTEKFEKCYTII